MVVLQTVHDNLREVLLAFCMPYTDSLACFPIIARRIGPLTRSLSPVSPPSEVLSRPFRPFWPKHPYAVHHLQASGNLCKNCLHHTCMYMRTNSPSIENLLTHRHFQSVQFSKHQSCLKKQRLLSLIARMLGNLHMIDGLGWCWQDACLIRSSAAVASQQPCDRAGV